MFFSSWEIQITNPQILILGHSVGCFEGKTRSKISETGEATPTKIDLHAFHIEALLALINSIF